MASAQFSINDDSGSQGFEIAPATTASFKLRENPTVGVYSVLFQTFDATGFNPGAAIALNPPRSSPSAPELTLDNGAGSTGRAVAPNGFNGVVTAAVPSPGPDSWIIRCVVNGGMKQLPNGSVVPDPTLIHERMLSTVVGGLRKIVATERTQFSNDGIAEAFARFAAVSGGLILMSPVSLTGASNTLVIGHAFKHLRVSHGSATTLTVPANSSVAFAIGTQIDLEQQGAGQLTVAAAGGVTIRTAETLKLRKQYSTASLKKLATDEWILAGDLELA